ncbi:site-specific DNA-methyltransferase [Accumulibacter sp.]|uniref:site-specific DNA-methyltransferase n=1 Tax=Accumulibacter sp. TaxID=2053492 RepID=UPI0025FE456F|nr:site-specific DNA-methyltransferase [Accumulibacter sp.]MCM8626882.1 site-specific DNA-methyltransferase [Accumulibacter sp.]
MPTLNWIGKEAVVRHHKEVPFRLLEPVPELSCGHGAGKDSGNLIVQGDNLHALKALLPRYAGQVKCIYIDPPYNTGNEGWVYNDNVNSPEIRKWLGEVVGKEGETLDRHDRWLCMMYPRLVLLKQFLGEDGAIFVSIDDNEVAALRLLMDEIFGAKNFVATVLWQEVYFPKNSARHLSEDHDYIVIYAAKADAWKPNLLPRTEEQNAAYKNPDKDPRGVWKTSDLSARNYYSAGTYSITCPSGRVIEAPPKGMYWRVSKEKFEELGRDSRIWWGKDGSAIPQIKRFLHEVKDGRVPQTMWFYQEVGHTQEGKKELLELVDFDTSVDVFITPKPTRLIQRILQIATDKDSIVLDSFAGSGTTGHAVLKQNVEDGGCRRFIQVEMLPEVASTITAGRAKRAISGYINAKGQAVEGLGGGCQFCPEAAIARVAQRVRQGGHHVPESDKVSWDGKRGTLTITAPLTEEEAEVLKASVTSDSAAAAIVEAAEVSRTTAIEFFQTPAELGECFRVPQLALRVQGELQLFDDPEVLDYPWDLSTYDAAPTGDEITALGAGLKVSEGGEIDVDGESGKVISRFLSDLQRDLGLVYQPEHWDEVRLATWLCRNLPEPSLTHASKQAFGAKWLTELLRREGFTLARANLQKFLLRNLLETRIRDLRRRAGGKAFQQTLFGDDAAARVAVTDGYAFEFHAQAYAPSRDYDGRFGHFDFPEGHCRFVMVKDKRWEWIEEKLSPSLARQN